MPSRSWRRVLAAAPGRNAARAWVIVLMAIACLDAPIAARAQIYPPPDDVIAFELSVEGDVETTTARVVVQFVVAQAGTGIAEARRKTGEILNTLSAAAPWRFSLIERDQDSAGLERWRITAEARMSTGEVSGLGQKAQAASKPGLQASVTTIEVTPTRAEREAALAKLRAEIYKRVGEELLRLGQIAPDRRFRIKEVRFREGEAEPAPRPLTRTAAGPGMATMMSDGGEMAKSSGLGVDDGAEAMRRVTLSASIMLAAPPPVSAAAGKP